MITNIIEFPKQQGLKCNMMPFIQGDSSSLPKEFKLYSEIFILTGILKSKPLESLEASKEMELI